MNIAEITVCKNSHDFKINVTDKGALTFQIDGGEVKNAKALKDGKLFFIGTQEIVVKGEIVERNDIELSKEDFSILEEAQKRVNVNRHDK